MGLRKAFEGAYQTFNNYLSNIVRKSNASVVGPGMPSEARVKATDL